MRGRCDGGILLNDFITNQERITIMELLYDDAYYDTPEWEEGKFASYLKAELGEYDDEIIAFEDDIGTGADFPVILLDLFNSVDWSTLLTVSGTTGFFFLGSKIEKNIDSWISLARRLGKLISKIKPTRIDEHAATLLAINDLDKNDKSISEMQVSLQILPFTPVPTAMRKLSKRPNALYLITIRTSDKLYVYEIKSDTTIISKNEIDTNW